MTVQLYELADGVRLKTVGTLLFQVVSLSKTGTVPLEVEQAWRGPGMAFTYQLA